MATKNKKTQVKTNTSVDINNLPALNQQANLNMNITKDDLIDVIIDNKLTELENSIKEFEKRKQELSVIDKELEKIHHINMDKLILSKVPSEILKFVKKRNYKTLEYKSYDGGCIHFYDAYDREILSVYNVGVNIIETYSRPKDMHEEIVLINTRIIEIKQEMAQLEKSPRRIKAKLISNFLNTSEEGKNILTLIKNQEIKLIG